MLKGQRDLVSIIVPPLSVCVNILSPKVLIKTDIVSPELICNVSLPSLAADGWQMHGRFNGNQLRGF